MVLSQCSCNPIWNDIFPWTLSCLVATWTLFFFAACLFPIGATLEQIEFGTKWILQNCFDSLSFFPVFVRAWVSGIEIHREHPRETRERARTRFVNKINFPLFLMEKWMFTRLEFLGGLHSSENKQKQTWKSALGLNSLMLLLSRLTSTLTVTGPGLGLRLGDLIESSLHDNHNN